MSEPQDPKEATEVAPTPPEEQAGDEGDKTQMDDAQGQLEVEVKEQDRWLPIANGASISLVPSAL